MARSLSYSPHSRVVPWSCAGLRFFTPFLGGSHVPAENRGTFVVFPCGPTLSFVSSYISPRMVKMTAVRNGYLLSFAYFIWQSRLACPLLFAAPDNTVFLYFLLWYIPFLSSCFFLSLSLIAFSSFLFSCSPFLSGCSPLHVRFAFPSLIRHVFSSIAERSY